MPPSFDQPVAPPRVFRRLNVVLCACALTVWGVNLAPPRWIAAVGLILPKWMQPMPVQNAEESIRMRNVASFGRYASALQFYPREHQGRYPDSFTVVTPVISGSELDDRFCNPHNGRFEDWIYFPGYMDSSPSGTIIMASPPAEGLARTIMTADGEASEVPEVKFQQLLKKQPPREW